MRRQRVDAELVRRGLARSRQHAQQLLDDGRVTLGGAGGTVVTKHATQVDTSAALVVAPEGETEDYVSRGGHKLAGALDALRQIDVAGRYCLDAGASTGGFTDVLLRRGAAHVAAVDVGYGQLAWSLRQDERVQVLDRCNVRALTPDLLEHPPSLLVSDLSFISLTLVMKALTGVAAPGADLVLMVKPQFEVGPARLGSGGVVRDPAYRVDAVLGVIDSAREHGLDLLDAAASPLPGPSGNVEYFVWLAAPGGPPRADEPVVTQDTSALVERIVADGPQDGVR